MIKENIKNEAKDTGPGTAAAMVLSGCSGGGKALEVEGPGAAETQKKAESAGGESEVIEIEFWHALETQYED